MKVKVDKLVLAGLSVFITAAIGSTATVKNVVDWYPTLNKPTLNPPNWIFGPVWTILYILMAISFYLVLVSKKSKFRTEAIKGSFFHLILNAFWSIVFFGLMSPTAALVEIVGLWLTIVLTIFYTYRVSKLAHYLLFPYLCWVTFAAWLNYQIVVLN